MDLYLRSILLRFVLNAVLVTAEFKLQTSFRENGKLFECPESGVFASPFGCQWFYTCRDTLPQLDRCPRPLYFDDMMKTCVCRSKDLKCGPITNVMMGRHIPYPYASPKCDQSMCKLPNCFCSEKGSQIPGNIPLKDTPQMIILTFTGPLNAMTEDAFDELFEGSRLNPNGCSIKATFFVPQEYTSYYYVQKMYSEGHEIAMQTLTNRDPDFWTKATAEQWAEEVIGLREMFHLYSNVSRKDLVGMRAPHLQAGGNNMMRMILDFGLEYDSSLEAPLSTAPVWPYTLDYSMPHECLATSCPLKSYPGIWEFPLNALGTNDITGSPCTFLEQCISKSNKDKIFDFLQLIFDHHYSTNKAPLVLNFQPDWLLHTSRMSALRSFISSVRRHHHDVWFVTMRQALEWVRHPVPTKVAHRLGSWKCSNEKQSMCNPPNMCFYELSDGHCTHKRYLELCGKCPKRYPGVRTMDLIE